MATATTGLWRTIVSLVHHVQFYEIGLSPRPRTLIGAVLVWLLISVLGLVFAESIWHGPPWLWWVWLVLPLVAWTIGQVRSDALSVPFYRNDETISRRLAQIGPSRREEDMGFQRLSFRDEPGGQVILSHPFNAGRMSDPDCDWTLRLTLANAEAEAIRQGLRPHRADLVAHGRRAFLAAATDGKALTNEPKVAFAADFPNGLPYVEVFRTSYFLGLCSVDRALQEVAVKVAGRDQTRTRAGDRIAPLLGGNWTVLPDFPAASQAVSLHLGIEVMALSKDGVLRIPLQSTRTQYSREMRAPLASGSVDWEDVEGSRSLKDILRRAARRELAEEWGAGAPALRQRLLSSRLEPVGYFRHPLRLGKPQFVAIGRLDCSDNELCADESEVFGKDDSPHAPQGAWMVFRITRLDDLRAAMENILQVPGPYRDSTALLGAAACLAGLLEREPARMARHFGLP
jgi:hypothetical protein